MSEHNHIHENSNHTDKYEQVLSKYELHIHDEDVHAAVNKITASQIAENNNDEVKRFLFSCLEITSLRVTDNEENILSLTERVNDFTNDYPNIPHPAAICVYPCFASIVSQSLEVEGVGITCVTGGFPSSQTFPEVKTIETALARKDGATEIDIVLPVGKFLVGDYESISEEIDEIKDYCEGGKLKVILETGALQTAENIKKAAIIAIYSGADFIKTSTGKISPAATPEAVYVMCQTIKEYHEKTGTQIGLKIAGGINTIDDALVYYTICKEILGSEWLKPELFRIGTSKLANELAIEITGVNKKFF